MTAQNSDQAFLSFTLGPVQATAGGLGTLQSFIASANSVRDLWTSSYLLSWLTYRALEPLVKRDDVHVVFPHFDNNKLHRFYTQNWRPRRDNEDEIQELLSPCLPNLFLAEVLADKGEDLAQQCKESCNQAWNDVCNKTLETLKSLVSRIPGSDGWADLWPKQCKGFFDLRTVVVPWSECDPALLKDLVEAESGDDDWTKRWLLLTGVAAAQKLLRRVPDYQPNGDVPQKCSLLGSLEQMGPARLQDSAEFWKAFSKTCASKGSRTRPNERLCAVSLVKRYAWPAYFVPHFTTQGGHNLDPRHLRYEDTATTAAQLWLQEKPVIDPDQLRDDERESWSGQWLHWAKREQGKEDNEPCPNQNLWDLILQKRRDQGKPPIYYAILMIDGDGMGKKFRSAGRERYPQISQALARYALNNIPILVRKHGGELIYAGGDDVLALLPAQTALPCALDLSNGFQANWREAGLSDPDNATVSAGLAVVHYKEDLRFALQQARKAEKEAKDRGRNALVLKVCRRSGEHSTAFCPWQFVPTVGRWVGAFLNKASDRWAYKLAADLDTLTGLPIGAMTAEIRRQVKRSEEKTKQLLGDKQSEAGEVIARQFDDYRGQEQVTGQFDDGAALRQFVTLCQSASFLARGREE